MLQKRKNYCDYDISTHDLCLEIAENIIAKEGVTALTLKSIANEVGIKLPSIYTHFSGIEVILKELGQIMLKDALKQYDHLDDLPADSAIIENTRLIFEYFAQRPGMARLCLTDFATPNGILAINENAELMRELFSKLDILIKRGVREGNLLNRDILNFENMRIGAILTSLSLTWIRLNEGQIPNKLKTRLLEENLSLVRNYICVEVNDR